CRIRQVRRRLIGTLSKGYRQRVGLADAMVADPPLLILDEPTVGLDPVQIRETLLLISELGEKRTILFSTHILSQIEAVCERVIVMHLGKVASDRPMKDLARLDQIVLEVHGPLEQVRSVLQTTDGVEEVIAQDGQTGGAAAFQVRTRGGKDLRETIA